MKRSVIVVTCATFLALLPGAASATYFLDLEFLPDCHGFAANMQIKIHSEEPAAHLSTSIYFIDSDGVKVLTIMLEQDIYDENGDELETVELASDWDSLTDEIVPLVGSYTIKGSFTLTYVEPADGRTVTVREEIPVPAECNVVPTDDASWSGLRGTYHP